MPVQAEISRSPLALSPAMLATALGVRNQLIADAIACGELGPVYTNGSRRRILAVNAERWIRDHWKIANTHHA